MLVKIVGKTSISISDTGYAPVLADMDSLNAIGDVLMSVLATSHESKDSALYDPCISCTGDIKDDPNASTMEIEFYIDDEAFDEAIALIRSKTKGA